MFRQCDWIINKILKRKQRIICRNYFKTYFELYCCFFYLIIKLELSCITVY